MNPKVLDLGQKIISGGLIAVSVSALGALGYGVYRVKVEKPKYLKSLQDQQQQQEIPIPSSSSSSLSSTKESK